LTLFLSAHYPYAAMGKKSRSKKNRESAQIYKAALRTSPNWPLLGIAVVGMLLTGYLTYTSLIGSSVRGCSAGGGCDLVLTSHWAKIFGLPTAFWGFLAYAGLAGIAFIKRADTHWRYAWTAAALGVSFSLYLTTISLTVIQAACPYCLTSLGLMTATLVLTTLQRPADLPGFTWKRWLTRIIPVAAVFIFAMHLQYVTVPEIPESPIARPLADHLTAIGAKMYGASWCEHCQAQKKYFGSAAERLPFVECKPGSPSAPLTQPCIDNNITSFPTWVIKDRRIEGVLGLGELADLSGFKAPVSASN
jgi:uncharacterized membrane protein